MKNLFFLLAALFLSFGCENSAPTQNNAENKDKVDASAKQSDADVSDDVSFDINMSELFGDWVLIGVGTDQEGPGTAPYGEILFAFRENGNMSVATEGKEELAANIAGIPSPYEVNGQSLCSDDIIFKMQFKQPCVEVVRLNKGRMSIKIELSEGVFMFKHFVRLDD